MLHPEALEHGEVEIAEWGVLLGVDRVAMLCVKLGRDIVIEWNGEAHHLHEVEKAHPHGGISMAACSDFACWSDV